MGREITTGAAAGPRSTRAPRIARALSFEEVQNLMDDDQVEGITRQREIVECRSCRTLQ